MASPSSATFPSPQQAADTNFVTINVAYQDAWSRGLVRQWKTRLANSYAIFSRAYGNDNLLAVAEDFAKRSSIKGRRRALDKLSRSFGPGAALNGLRIDGKHPTAVWSILKPRNAVTVNATPESGLAQDCVCLNYILAGRINTEIMLDEGLWTLEVPDHALGRAVEISRRLPDTIIADAHRNQLALSATVARHSSDSLDYSGPHFLVKAGDGGFICQLRIDADEVRGELDIRVRTRTWLSNDMLGDNQVVLVGEGIPGERLGDNWLMPKPLLQAAAANALAARRKAGAQVS
jgi:hypothetical protein